MAETHDLTDASPSPFRRFPWVQLVFCLACLGMVVGPSVSAWMEYTSYAEVRADEVDEGWVGRRALVLPAEPGRGRYVADYPVWHSGHTWGLDLPIRGVVSGVGPGPKAGYRFEDIVTQELEDYGWDDTTLDDPLFIDLDGERRGLDSGTSEKVPRSDERPIVCIYIDPRYPRRHHPAAVAGIAVGAMGVFVFGLHLRRWLRERKTT